ncbi:hypothetical protein IW262DRAFT_1305065 [Armillaria fumosa]|nr:hypothetical protein IW262DRAFT_1305065 [Armillaria fumosa]
MSASYASTSRSTPVASSFYRPPYATVQSPMQRAPIVTDDYERWYTEQVPNNRMALSLQSGIEGEVGWALDRLCRLCHNEQFQLKVIPGIIDGLFIWPEWYVLEGHRLFNSNNTIFAVPRDMEAKRRHAIESLFVLRNCALHEQDCQELVHHSHSLPLIYSAFNNLDPQADDNTEFLLHATDFLHSISAHYTAPASVVSITKAVLSPLGTIASTSSNRPSIIAALTALSQLIENPHTATLLSPDSPVLAASLRFLPLFGDKPLVETCLNYLYAHLSHYAMAKAFLLHPDMPSILRILINLLIQEQVEETVTMDITGAVRTVPSQASVTTQDHDLSQEELEQLLPLPEPERCYEWMKTMFIGKPDGELTQVDFWNLYKDVFAPHQDKYPLLVASDVIKNVNLVFPEAQAMVLQDPVQRFIVRGVDRRKDTLVAEKLKCQWDRGQCTTPPFSSLNDLYEHLLDHLKTAEGPEYPCLWSSCPNPPVPKASLRSHVLTHLSRKYTPERHPSQSDTITLSVGTTSPAYPAGNPITRTPPPPRSTTINYRRPLVDPPSSSLTALLCIRILFRTSFASADEAPRIDEDHFGFPGIVEEVVEDIEDVVIANRASKDREKEGERRGRRAFINVRQLMEGVRIRDENLMGWITEMATVDTEPGAQ